MPSRNAHYWILEFLLCQYFSYYNNIHTFFSFVWKQHKVSTVQGLTKCHFFEQSVYFIIKGIIIFCCDLEDSQTGSVSLSNVERDRSVWHGLLLLLVLSPRRAVRVSAGSGRKSCCENCTCSTPDVSDHSAGTAAMGHLWGRLHHTTPRDHCKCFTKQNILLIEGLPY